MVQNVAPVPEKPTITVQEAVARNMLKLRAKLGITPVDLFPASVALESENISNQMTGAHDAQAKAEEGEKGHVRCEAAPTPDIGRWKKEADDMLSLLGTNSEKCTHAYPMMELKRKVCAGEAGTLSVIPPPPLQNQAIRSRDVYAALCKTTSVFQIRGR